MSILNPAAGYFSIPNPQRLFDRWLNPCRYPQRLQIDGREIELRWNKRAQRELERRDTPLLVELQLYFSCVVKKRILFHDSADFDSHPVNPSIRLAYRAIASAACDPNEFAASFPGARELTTDAAKSMLPRYVEIDYVRGGWQGRFSY